ncbi:hypothetical protein ElyMa_000597000 [Elysia marginata]|uniref:Uncharacterized protein n=1 Tax=Elysia marginata TaxID=1093978 RepID=A0AAV4G982_9GAST|nr:hypothetical protein ElyMa_000597000 [Elysia marginata]
MKGVHRKPFQMNEKKELRLPTNVHRAGKIKHSCYSTRNAKQGIGNCKTEHKKWTLTVVGSVSAGVIQRWTRLEDRHWTLSDHQTRQDGMSWG